MKLRCSLSVIGFKEKIMKVWGLQEWQGMNDPDQDLLFFGLYTFHDWDCYWYHQGKKTVFWCGSDILNTLDNTEFQRRLRLFPDAEHWCETEVEAENLRKLGIEPKIAPSFLENLDEFPIKYQYSETPHIWMCSHPGREREYGVDTAIRMAKLLPEFTFHIYGIFEWQEEEKPANVIYHGQVANETLNREIRDYQGSLRCNDHDGFSEVPIKTILIGGYPITKMKFEKIWNYQTDEELVKLLKSLKNQKDWNREGYRHWRSKVNNYPWVQ